MYSKEINELCNEAQRLLSFSIEKLKEISNIPDILQQEKSSTASLDFSIEGIKKQIEVLDGEQQKLTNKEMVLAVVGTMKAGKSTAINAIVGTEVLPNRNRPMTALPTLIRHTKGQKTPVLSFPHTSPINQLMRDLKQEQKNKSFGHLEEDIKIDKDMQILLSQIEAGHHFEKQYHGTEQIFHFLKNLNDLVRLSAALNIQFPFNEYATIDRIPSIDIEFVHLTEAGEGHGQLTLLDTPGPNEAGQQHLRVMLEDQLRKASAVLIVLDYGQLKSTSDEDVRKCVSAISKNVPVYALVNRFDQRDRNSDDEEQVKNLVSDQLLKNVLTKEKVFPVSSLLAYLANRVRHEVNLYGKLPPASIDSKNPTWIDDFAKLALGPFDEPEKLQDTTFSLRVADMIWQKSLFSSPIENIIKSAHKKASLMFLKAATSKLVDYSIHTKDHFQMKSESLLMAIEELNKSVAALTNDINLLDKAKDKIKSTISSEILETNKKVVNFTNETSDNMSKKIDYYFEKGKVDEETRNELDVKSSRKGGKRQKNKGTGKSIVENIFITLFNTAKHKDLVSAWRSANVDTDFYPNEDQIKFNNSSEANEFVSEISNSVGDILEISKDHVVRELDSLLQVLEKHLIQTISDTVKPIETKVQAELKEAGFTVSLNFPTFNSRRLNFSADSAFNNAVEKKQKSVTLLRRSSGVWGTICGWFNTDDWGWEEYQDNVDSYVITLSKLKIDMQKQIDELSSSLKSAISEQITDPVNKTMDDFFMEFSDKLGSVRANLQQSALTQKKNQGSLEKIKQQAGLYSSTYQKILNDSEELKRDFNQLENEQNVESDVTE
ncbi:dynamin family protein [Enterobacter asburiae]|nr:dynamin family protein [Enterobacter asburiae]